MQRIFLDTNIYILGQLNPASNEEAILKKIGFYDSQQQSSIQVIISQELSEQILRVCKRIQNKDCENSRSHLAESQLRVRPRN
ncbi:MAG: hypothetical protein GDA56_13950 [Hormoscilla sp. GM7CHS1pb]|nr:hypothetical protein [Hormoscilla sp. GM7CHS1pb]